MFRDPEGLLVLQMCRERRPWLFTASEAQSSPIFLLDSLLKSGEFSVGVRKTTFSHFVGGFEKPWRLVPNTGLFERVKGICHSPTHSLQGERKILFFSPGSKEVCTWQRG